MSQHRVDIRYVYTDPQGKEFVFEDCFFSEEAPTVGKIKDRLTARYIPRDFRALYKVTAVEEKGSRHFAVVAQSIANTECVGGHEHKVTYPGSIPGKIIT